MDPKTQQTLIDLQSRIQALETKRTMIFDIYGLFQTVSVAPTGIPHSIYDQIKIYVNSTTYRLYVYDFTNNVWHYATLT